MPGSQHARSRWALPSRHRSCGFYPLVVVFKYSHIPTVRRALGHAGAKIVGTPSTMHTSPATGAPRPCLILFAAAQEPEAPQSRQR